MIETRPCTSDDAVAVSTLLGELGYTVSVRQATEQGTELRKTGWIRFFSRSRMVRRPDVRVTALVVDRRARRRGVGKLLMEHAERMGSAAGCEFVELTSAIDRTEAHAFYRNIGYNSNSLRFRKPLVRQ